MVRVGTVIKTWGQSGWGHGSVGSAGLKGLGG